MVEGVTPQKMMGACDTSAIERNSAFGHKYRVNGTPAVLFEDGKRVPGAIPLAEVEKRLAEAARAPKT